MTEQRATEAFESTEEQLAALRAAEEQLRKALAKECDWRDKEEFYLWRRETNHERRTEALDKHCPNRVCLNCGEGYSSNRCFVLLPVKRRTSEQDYRSVTGVVCRRCYFRETTNARLDSLYKGTVSNAFTERVPFVVIECNGKQIAHCRTLLEVTQENFATLAGWSRATQARLESMNGTHINEEQAEVILQVFTERLDVDEDDEELAKCFGETQVDYRVCIEGKAIRAMRKLAQMTASELATAIGWSRMQIRRLEESNVLRSYRWEEAEPLYNFFNDAKRSVDAKRKERVRMRRKR